MMGVSQRDKGKRGEREAAAVLRALLDDPTITRALDQPRDGGCDLTGATLQHFHVEVKRVRAPQLRVYLDKAAAHSERVPVVMWRGDRTDWQYYLKLDALRLRQFVHWMNDTC